jgi:nucleoside-diphosphate-sugar epimerase
MKVAITGGLGFIGSHVARRFVTEGCEVVLIDNHIENTKLIKDILQDVKIKKGDITRYAQFRNILLNEKPDVVIHLAALLSAAAESDPKAGYKVNFEGLWNVYNTALESGSNILIFASSIAAYGPIEVESLSKEEMSEDVYTLPQTLYGIHKQLGEMLGIWFHRRYGINFAALRLGSVIGPGRKDGGASAYSSLLIQLPAQGKPYKIPVPENTKIPLVYIKDVSDVMLEIIRNIKNIKSKIYNISSIHNSPTVAEMVRAVREIIPEASLNIEVDPKVTKFVNIWPRNLNLRRIESELGWKSKYRDLDVLVEDFITEVTTHPDMYHI